MHAFKEQHSGSPADIPSHFQQSPWLLPFVLIVSLVEPCGAPPRGYWGT
jgi:hypothetical protein